ncbi:hypothetical protein OCK74_24395 [Chitinophagaceae bacterium LB-8]|uniref:Esterase n=1 Tax=Paraflavisolibacter caeni TaxID=2982496 RepID=A0A9X2Y0G8_9BACT|nr:hypothetical protein [Paraflavisolibacter caeni]MCU7552282.1 hypothetical protein [Paraflavisolibacter caeni]
MKKVSIVLIAVMFYGIASAQFVGVMRNQQEEPLPMSIGTEEGQRAKQTYEKLKNHGIKNLVYHESQGTAHEWLTWRRALNDFAPRLFK